MAGVYSRQDEEFRAEVEAVYNEICLGSDELIEDFHVTPPDVGNASLQERFGKLDIFRKPQCLVSTNAEGTFKLEEHVLDQISRIDVPVCVVGIAGVYRSGKSYLMNRIAGKKSGFALGGTVRSETKGIWVLCQPHPKENNQVIILLDTEGLLDASKGDRNYDTKIFALTLLMSTVIIFNIKGVIDTNALECISFVAKATKSISVSGDPNDQNNQETLKFIVPQFILCLRDFFYQLADDGEMIPDQYMESFLELKEDDSKKFNETREEIKKFFPNRKCFVVAQPALNKKLLELEKLSEADLDEDFKNQVDELVKHVHGVGPKLLDEVTRKVWDGYTFAIFSRSYLKRITDKLSLEYTCSMEEAGKRQNSKLVVITRSQFKNELDKLVLKDPEPNRLTLIDKALAIMTNLQRDFREKAYPYLVEKFEDEATEEMKQYLHEVIEENSKKIEEMLRNYLLKEHGDMVSRRRGQYFGKGGEDKYNKDMKDLLQRYNERFKKYDVAERSMGLQQFEKDIEVHRSHMQNTNKLAEEIERYGKLAIARDAYVDEFLAKELARMKESNKMELERELGKYKRTLSGTQGGHSFFQRLKYLFTGSFD